jgi:ATP/maltotriose-dependent transcriptional regulator MalT
VLVWLAQGKGNAEITQILGIKLTTVKTHIMRIFDKLGVGNRHEAILRAHELARLGAREAPNPGMRRLSARAARH